MPYYIYHTWSKHSDVETYKELRRLFTMETPEIWQQITCNTFHTWDKTPGFNFENGDYVMVLEGRDFKLLRDKQIYLILHCWAHFHKIDILEVLCLIKEAIKNEYTSSSRYLPDDETYQQKMKDIYHASLDLFNELLKRLPPELSLEYIAKYE